MTDGTPRRRLRRILATALVAALAAGGAVVWQGRSKGQAAVDHAPPPAVRPIELAPVEVTTVMPRTLTAGVRLTGSVKPLEQSTVKAEVAAKLTEVLVREGQTVKRGDVLARFDRVELAAKLAEKESNLEGAKAQLVLAEKTRAKNLALRRSDIVAETTLDQAQSTFQFQQAQVAALTAQVELAREALRDAVVTAPIDGTVSERTVTPGETLAVNAKMFTLVDLRTVEVEAVVPADEVARLKPGQTATFRVDGFGEREFRGTIARINPMTQAGSRAIPVYVGVDNADGSLRGGMFANGEAVVAEAAGAIALPPTALRKDDDGDFVLAVADGQLVRRKVVRGSAWARGDLVQVDGLNPGEVVVTGPLPGLKAGTAVTVAGRS
ncbi:efflux RND transporter periplasmic adaptor subunit [Azospirillum sp.]|uniref:efflux RND transporter periplasmic adaptor subunit n=1 Tax=Azospirillum sp. TaxID=34012 RepID=UPI002D5274C4|nr:efflux RND transporter periplasmic adaptor subunit [Azospirillum sp.]HYD64121.1 efflux RND transporter periplasmic adaptor subunit [Azospirillum sp.]